MRWPNGSQVASRWRRRRSPACWPAWPASRSCRSRPARRSAIRCWRPSASSPPGGWPPPARKRRCTPGCCEWALEVARSAEAALPGAEWPRWSGRLSADQANIRAALSWALGGAEPEAGRELAARLARWWIATGRYSEAGQFLTTAAGVPAAADPGIQARVLLGAAWSAYHLGDNPRAAPLAADGIACARQAGEPQLEVWGRNLLAGLAWHAGDADRIVAELEASRALSGQADPALAARAQVLLANAAFLAGDLAEQDRHGRLAIELARTAAGQEGLALALTMLVDVRDRRSGHPARHRGRAG